MKIVRMHAPASRVEGDTQPLRPARRDLLAGALALARGLRRAGLLRALLHVLGMFVIVHALAYVADTYAPDSSTLFLQTDRRHVENILADAREIDALAVGSSHAGSVQMPELGYRSGYRFPRADGDLFETQILLRYLAPRLPKMKVVLVPISYFSFLEENSSAAEVEIRRAHLYASLPSWQVIPGDYKAFLVGKSHTYFPVARLIREDNWEGVFRALLGRGEPPEGFVEVAPGDCSWLTPGQLAASAENRVDKYTRLAAEMSARHPGLAEDAYAALAEMTRDLLRRGIRPIYFTPPYWDGYNDLYQARDPQAIALMRSQIERLQREFGVAYYDYAQDAQFSQRPELFKDSDHLNSCGAALFSEELSRRIQEQPAKNKP